MGASTFCSQSAQLLGIKLSRDRDEHPDKCQWNEHDEQVRQRKRHPDEPDEHGATHDKHADSSKHKEQEDCDTEQSNEVGDQTRQTNATFERSGDLLTVDDDPCRSRIDEEPPNNDRQNGYCKGDGCFLGHSNAFNDDLHQGPFCGHRPPRRNRARKAQAVVSVLAAVVMVGPNCSG
jgi:hypothetical protein